jgi:hypothetical protein
MASQGAPRIGAEERSWRRLLQRWRRSGQTVVLAQPTSNTTPSSGLARIDSSSSMLMRLRRYMAVGRILNSPKDMTGNSKGTPPACHSPRFTASDTGRKKSAVCGRQGSATRGRLFSWCPSGRISKTVSLLVYFQLARSILTTLEPARVTSPDHSHQESPRSVTSG